MALADIDELNRQKAALEKARFGGVREIQHGEKTVSFKSQAELDKAAAALNDAINTAGGRKRTRHVRFTTNRGT